MAQALAALFSNQAERESFPQRRESTFGQHMDSRLRESDGKVALSTKVRQMKALNSIVKLTMGIASKRQSKRRAQASRWFAGTLMIGLAVVQLGSKSSEVVAQAYQSNGYNPAYQPKNHELTRGDMAPGVVADIARMSNPQLEGHVQPVRVIAPKGSLVGVGTSDGYVETSSSKTSVGLTVGPVYRFKVTNIPNRPGFELYPSVEVLNRLAPPEGLENEFPIQVVISQSDLEEALEGRMVTKVVYLEDPRTALPHRHWEDKQPYFDVGGGEDPLRVAQRLGRPMAILRIGSRIPMPSDAGERFGFNAPSPKILPAPEQVPFELEPIPSAVKPATEEPKPIEPAISSAKPMQMPTIPKSIRPMRPESQPNSALPPVFGASFPKIPTTNGKR